MTSCSGSRRSTQKFPGFGHHTHGVEVKTDESGRPYYALYCLSVNGARGEEQHGSRHPPDSVREAPQDRRDRRCREPADRASCSTASRAENFEIEVTDRFERDVSEDAGVGAYIAMIDGERLEQRAQLARAVRASGFRDAALGARRFAPDLRPRASSSWSARSRATSTWDSRRRRTTRSRWSRA